MDRVPLHWTCSIIAGLQTVFRPATSRNAAGRALHGRLGVQLPEPTPQTGSVFVTCNSPHAAVDGARTSMREGCTCGVCTAASTGCVTQAPPPFLNGRLGV
eukprot:365520-Chlamydomonas_euryale.AAC.14